MSSLDSYQDHGKQPVHVFSGQLSGPGALKNLYKDLSAVKLFAVRWYRVAR